MASPGFFYVILFMIEIIPFQSSWTTTFNNIAAQLRASLSGDALAIHHIGSTSVPGLAAKNVIDIQVTVSHLQVAVQQQLEENDFIFHTGNIGDHKPPGRDDLGPAELAKLFYHKNEPRVNLHIRERGRFNQRYPLLCRDYLRSHPLAAKAYEEIKKQLAHHFPNDANAYYAVKDPVFDLIMSGAEDWATFTGWQLPASDA